MLQFVEYKAHGVKDIFNLGLINLNNVDPDFDPALNRGLRYGPGIEQLPLENKGTKLRYYTTLHYSLTLFLLPRLLLKAKLFHPMAYWSVVGGRCV